MFDGSGPAFNCQGNYQTYLNLAPKAAGAGGSGSGALVIVVVIAVVAAGAALTGVRVIRRRRPIAEES